MNILTFDIEEWFHLLDNPSTKTEQQWNGYESRIYRNMDIIFKILDITNTKATFFCLGWIAKKYPDVIKEIHNRGYEIGTHSNMHQLAYEQNREEFKMDLDISIKTIEGLIGDKIRIYRAPGFSIKQNNKWALEVLAEQGIEIDCSIFPAERAHGGFMEFDSIYPCLVQVGNQLIKEFPISPVPIFGQKVIYSGGGYFRFFPYKLIKKLTQKADYTMSYFHPRDFDSNQPVIKDLSTERKFRAYYGLDKAYDKLVKFLTDFEFSDLATAEKKIDWNKAKTIIL